MRALTRKVVKDLWRSRGLALAIIAISAIGIGCFVGLVNLYINLNQAQGNYYTQVAMPDVWVELDAAPHAITQRLQDIASIGQMETRLQESALTHIDGEQTPIASLLLSLPAARQARLARTLCVHGAYPQAVDEVLVLEKFAKARALEIGDRFTVTMHGQQQEVRVSGFALSAEFLYTAAPGSVVPDPAGFNVMWMAQHDMERWYDKSGLCNQLLLTWANEDKTAQATASMQIRDRLASYGVQDWTPLERQGSHVSLSSELLGLRVMSVMLPTIFLLVSILVTSVLMSRIAEQQRSVLGILKALGYSRSELQNHLLQFSMTIGILGGMLGLACGLILAFAMTEVYREFFSFPNLDVRLALFTIIGGPLLGALVAAFGSRGALKEVHKLSPAAAMRPVVPSARNIDIFTKYIPFWNKWNFTWQMSVRDVLRQPRRAAMSMLTIALGTAVLMMILSMGQSIVTLANRAFGDALRYDMSLGLNKTYDENALREIASLPGIDLAEPQFLLSGEFYSPQSRRSLGISGIDADAQLTQLLDAEGRVISLPKSGLVLERRLADEFQVYPGAFISFQQTDGEQRELSLPVAGIYDGTVGMAVYADREWLARQIGEVSLLNDVQILYSSEESAEFTAMQGISDRPSILGLNNLSAMKAELERLILSKLTTIQTVMGGFAGIIFLGTVINTALVSLSERQREVGTLRSLGYSQRNVFGMFFRESLLLASIGVPLGLLIGRVQYLFVISQFKTDIYSAPSVFNPLTPVSAMFFGFIFVVLANIAVFYLLRRLDWREAVRSKE